ncbi:MAG: acyl carrier protein [Spirochaetes bacterium]|nr:acyl carrier protein [Spirochaetota bacterium]
MDRQILLEKILDVFKEEFEIIDPDPDNNLTEKYEFDSIDAIVLLEYIEKLLGSELTQEEKKQSMECRTINNIIDYIENIQKNRN